MERLAVLATIVVNGAALCLLERSVGDGRSDRPAGPRRLAPNLALTGLLLGLNVGLDRAVAAAGIVAPGDRAGVLGRLGLGTAARLLATVVALDGLAYLAHVLMHALPLAWRFHRVHHSDARVDVSTAFRQHPLETVWRHSFLSAGALALGASSREVALSLALSAVSAQLEHAEVSLPSGWDRVLRAVFSTPAVHRVHHSRRLPDTDRNYGNVFSLWDRVLGTYRVPRAGEVIAVGLEGCEPPEAGAIGLLALPFQAIAPPSSPARP